MFQHTNFTNSLTSLFNVHIKVCKSAQNMFLHNTTITRKLSLKKPEKLQ